MAGITVKLKRNGSRLLIPNGKVRSSLRRLWLYSWQRKEVLAKAKVDRGLYICALCVKIFHYKSVAVDHKVQVGNSSSWQEWIEKLFCPVDGLQVLCHNCHEKKGRENNERYSKSKASKTITRAKE